TPGPSPRAARAEGSGWAMSCDVGRAHGIQRQVMKRTTTISPRAWRPRAAAGGNHGISFAGQAAQHEVRLRQRGWSEDLLPTSGGRHGAGADPTSRISDVVPHVPRPDPGPG